MSQYNLMAVKVVFKRVLIDNTWIIFLQWIIASCKISDVLVSFLLNKKVCLTYTYVLIYVLIKIY